MKSCAAASLLAILPQLPACLIADRSAAVGRSTWFAGIGDGATKGGVQHPVEIVASKSTTHSPSEIGFRAGRSCASLCLRSLDLRACLVPFGFKLSDPPTPKAVAEEEPDSETEEDRSSSDSGVSQRVHIYSTPASLDDMP